MNLLLTLNTMKKSFVSALSYLIKSDFLRQLHRTEAIRDGNCLLFLFLLYTVLQSWKVWNNPNYRRKNSIRKVIEKNHLFQINLLNFLCHVGTKIL